jgi:hypothetical protein
MFIFHFEFALEIRERCTNDITMAFKDQIWERLIFFLVSVFTFFSNLIFYSTLSGILLNDAKTFFE